MAVQRTFSIIKPDAVAKNQIGAIQSRFEQAGLKIVAAKMLQLSEQVAAGFYAEHKERGFFKDLVGFMTSGPVLVQVLEGENAIAKNRELMGATNQKGEGQEQPGREHSAHGQNGEDGRYRHHHELRAQHDVAAVEIIRQRAPGQGKQHDGQRRGRLNQRHHAARIRQRRH